MGALFMQRTWTIVQHDGRNHLKLWLNQGGCFNPELPGWVLCSCSLVAHMDYRARALFKNECLVCVPTTVESGVEWQSSSGEEGEQEGRREIGAERRRGGCIQRSNQLPTTGGSVSVLFV